MHLQVFHDLKMTTAMEVRKSIELGEKKILKIFKKRSTKLFGKDRLLNHFKYHKLRFFRRLSNFFCHVLKIFFRLVRHWGNRAYKNMFPVIFRSASVTEFQPGDFREITEPRTFNPLIFHPLFQVNSQHLKKFLRLKMLIWLTLTQIHCTRSKHHR